MYAYPRLLRSSAIQGPQGLRIYLRAGSAYSKGLPGEIRATVQVGLVFGSFDEAVATGVLGGVTLSSAQMQFLEAHELRLSLLGRQQRTRRDLGMPRHAGVAVGTECQQEVGAGV